MRPADLAPDQALAAVRADTRRYIWWGMAVLAVGVGGFGFWAATAPLDEGVPTVGTVAVEAKRKTVQHLAGGIVKSVLVNEAATVRANQTLVELDDTQVRASYDAAVQSWFALLASEARLRTEQSGSAEIAFPVELDGAQALARSHMEMQRKLLRSRRQALQADLDVLAQNATATETQARGLEEQLAFTTQELANVRKLAGQGFYSKQASFETERRYADLNASALRARQSAAEIRLRATQRRQQYDQEVATQLADVQRDRQNAGERVRSLREDLARSRITAPIDGTVTGLAVHTVGGVIAAGQKLMDIVPRSGALIVEARVPSHLVDRVQAGAKADINLHAFAANPQMIVAGHVLSVSADLLPDPNPQLPPSYLARIAITPEGQRQLGSHQLQPGMPADVIIKTGERTLLTYLMKPLLRRLNAAMTES